MTITAFTLRLLLALLLGGIIGVERQWRQRTAGLRTNMLVALGASMFVAMALKLGNEAAGRVISYVVSGIGFLGAGVIMKDGVNVRGLNTAATLWCSAAVGALCGMGFLPEAVVGSVCIILTHLVMRPVGVRLSRLPIDKDTAAQTEYLFTIKCRERSENHIRVLLMQHLGNDDNLLLRSLTSSDNGNPSVAVITAEITAIIPQDSVMEKTAGRLTIERDVIQVKWEVAGVQTDI
jgi:putative Mg2+ transporter-C (MgtC) family protein